MSKDSYRYIREGFGIDPLEQFIQERQDKFNKKYSASENVFCIVISRC